MHLRPGIYRSAFVFRRRIGPGDTLAIDEPRKPAYGGAVRALLRWRSGTRINGPGLASIARRAASRTMRDRAPISLTAKETSRESVPAEATIPDAIRPRRSIDTSQKGHYVHAQSRRQRRQRTPLGDVLRSRYVHHVDDVNDVSLGEDPAGGQRSCPPPPPPLGSSLTCQRQQSPVLAALSRPA